MRQSLIPLLLLLLSGCSLTLPDTHPCTQTQECRNAFGHGSVCQGDGFCDVFQPGPRCSIYPDSLTLPIDPEKTLLFASLFNYANETHKARALSARLAVTQFNEDSVLDGKKVALMECTNEASPTLDDLSQDDATVAVTQYLAEELGVAVLIGPSSSGRVTLAYHAAQSEGMLVISPSATSTSLIDLDGANSTEDSPGLLWRTAGPDNVQGEKIAQDLAARGIQSVAVIYRTGTYGDSLVDAVHDHFIGETIPYSFTTPTGRDETTAEVGDSGVEEVLFISSEVSDISAFLNTAAQLESYNNTGIFLTDSAANQDVLDAASDAKNIFPQVRLSKPLEPEGNIYNKFAQSFSDAYGGADVTNYSYSAHTFDATWIALHGAAWSLYQEGRIYGEGVARGLRHISEGPEVKLGPTDWNKGVAQFQNGADINIVGASGELDYDAEYGETRATIGVLVISPDGSSFLPAP